MSPRMPILVSSAELRLQPLLARIRSLPPLPEALREVLRALHDGQLSQRRCVALIEQDPALAAATLRLANSAFYGMPGQVGSVADGVQLLGLNAVAGVLAATAMAQHLRTETCPSFNPRHYWHHALLTGQAARALARLAHTDADMAFLTGLLHDVGQLLMAACWPEEAAEALARADREGEAPEVAEAAVLGLGHPQLGALLVRHWHFPAALVEAVARHHDTAHLGPQPTAAETQAGQSVPPPLTALVQLANTLADACAEGLSAEALPAWARARCTSLGLSDAALAEMMQNVSTDAAALQAALRVG